MEKEQIASKVKEIIADKAGCEISEVKDDTNCENELGMDSLDRAEVIMELEKEFNIDVPDEEYSNARTTTDFIGIVERNKK